MMTKKDSSSKENASAEDSCSATENVDGDVAIPLPVLCSRAEKNCHCMCHRLCLNDLNKSSDIVTVEDAASGEWFSGFMKIKAHI